MADDCPRIHAQGYYGDPPSDAEVRMVRADGERPCCECFDVIPGGAEFEETTGTWRGERLRFSTCSACADVRSVVMRESFLIGELWEAMSYEELLTPAKAPAACLFRELTPAGAEKLKQRWQAMVDEEAKFFEERA